MREPGISVAPKRPESPFSVCTARKTSLTSSGSLLAALDDLVEREQIAAEPVDDLLRLGEELLARLVDRSVVRAPPPCSAIGVTLAAPGEELRRTCVAELLRREGLRDERVGAEREPALDVALGGLRRDDDERRRPVVLATSRMK